MILIVKSGIFFELHNIQAAYWFKVNEGEYQNAKNYWRLCKHASASTIELAATILLKAKVLQEKIQWPYSTWAWTINSQQEPNNTSIYIKKRRYYYLSIAWRPSIVMAPICYQLQAWFLRRLTLIGPRDDIASMSNRLKFVAWEWQRLGPWVGGGWHTWRTCRKHALGTSFTTFISNCLGGFWAIAHILCRTSKALSTSFLVASWVLAKCFLLLPYGSWMVVTKIGTWNIFHQQEGDTYCKMCHSQQMSSLWGHCWATSPHLGHSYHYCHRAIQNVHAISRDHA